MQTLKVVRDEFQCFEDNIEWELVYVPKNGTIEHCRWVSHEKNGNYPVTRYSSSGLERKKLGPPFFGLIVR